MRILILGASGLIGSNLGSALRLHGHQVLSLSRHADIHDVHARQGDFAQMTTPPAWLPLLAGVDVVVNAVGIFAETATQSFQTLHVSAPLALLAACEQAGVSRLIHISALGAQPDAATAYWRSKGEADAALLASTLNWTILRPSLIYAPNGTSSRVFCSIASLPLLPDLQGVNDVQPVHINDVIALLLNVIRNGTASRQIVDVVGNTALPLSSWWQKLRQAMAISPAKTIKVYGWMQDIGCAVSRYLPSKLFSRDSLIMLRAGNTADVAPLTALLGRAPLAALPCPAERQTLRQAAMLTWLLPLLRLSLALVWLLTALVSWLWPRFESYALLGATGIPASLQPLLFYGSVLMDAALGVACLFNTAWRWQLLLVLFYSVLIAIQIPEFLWHPFGPLLKNLPILALLFTFDRLKNQKHIIHEKHERHESSNLIQEAHQSTPAS